MQRITRILVATAFLAIGMNTKDGSAETGQRTANSPHMAEYGRTVPPIGHVTFCTARPSECKGFSKRSGPVALTSARWRELKRVNQSVNRMITPATDLTLYGKAEHWTYPSAKGDCEDYVLLKRLMLLERGWPEDALLITVVRDLNNDGHAVLTVATDRGDFILDNKQNAVMPWTKTDYRYLKRQSRNHPARWVALDPKTASIRTWLFGGLGK